MENKNEIITKKENGILTIKINRPKKKNAFNSYIMDQLFELLSSVETDDSIKIVYFTAVGDTFSSGNDFNNFFDKKEERLLIELKFFIDSLINFKKITVAGVNGMSVGISMTMLALFDFVVCAESAFFIVPFIQTFQSPEACSSLLFPRIFGKAMGNHLLLNGGVITSEEAKTAGFVSHVFENESFETDAYDFVLKLSKHTMDLMIKYKEMINRNGREELLKVNEYEVNELAKSWNSPEFDKIKKMMLEKKNGGNPKF